MKKSAIGVHQTILPNRQAPDIAQPANRALHDPAALGAAQLPLVLVDGPLVTGASWDDRLNLATHQQGSGSIAVVPYSDLLLS